MIPTKFLLHFFFLILCFLLFLPSGGAQPKDGGGKPESSPAIGQEVPRKLESQILYDSRERTYGKPDLSRIEKQKLFSQLFPKYLKRHEDCEDYEGRQEDDIKEGQFSPFVQSVAHGAFTKAGRKETAYLINRFECHTVGNSWTAIIVVVSEGRVVAQQESHDFYMSEVSDMNGDGVQELLLERGNDMPGYSETYARLVSFSQGRFQVLKDFGLVRASSCGAMSPNSKSLKTVIAYRTKPAGMMSDFEFKNYEEKCVKEVKPLDPVSAANWNPSGDYGLFEIAVDPKTNIMTGYYVSETGLRPDGGPMFSCIFYLTGKKEGTRASIQTYYPADKKPRETILGEIVFVPEQEALRIKLTERPPGSLACPDVVEGDFQFRDSKPESEWLEIRVVKAPKAHFFETPEAVAPRKTYVVEGDGVEVLERRPGWVLVTFRGKNKGWLKGADLYPK